MHKPKKKSWGLVVALIVLILAIIGLTAGIIINHNNTISEEPEGSELTVKEQTLDEILDYIGNVDIIDDAKEYLDEKVEEYNGTDLEIDVKLIKARYLRDIGEYMNALEVMNDLLDKSLDLDYSMEVYSVVSSIYKKIGDEESAEKYNDMYWEVYLRKNNGGAGGA